MLRLSSALSWLRVNRGLILLALIACSATGYVACGGNDHEFGTGPAPGSDTGSSSTDKDTSDDTNDADDAPTSNNP
jgi:hypothetical protein